MGNQKHSLISEFILARRSTYLRINLDTILNNINILKQKCSEITELMIVVKANAYGHGSAPVCKFLEEHGCYDFAVATGSEGEELRRSGVTGNIYVLGSCSVDEIPTCYENYLIPTASNIDFLVSWVEYWTQQKTENVFLDECGIGKLMIKIDTGMSRNGCQPSELPELVEFCKNNEIPIHSMYTHFAQAWDDHVFTKDQYKTFLEAVRPYRSAGIKFHVSNSGAILKGIGTDLDYVRPGLAVYGLPQDTSDYCISKTSEIGLRPAVCWMAKTSLVKRLSEGRKVGYDQTYVCKDSETVACVPLGYVDGYPRNTLHGTGTVTTLKGDVCPVIGRISMDAITIKLPDNITGCQELYVIKDDFNPTNSIITLAKLKNSIPCETSTNFGSRLPRLYVKEGTTVCISR